MWAEELFLHTRTIKLTIATITYVLVYFFFTYPQETLQNSRMCLHVVTFKEKLLTSILQKRKQTAKQNWKEQMSLLSLK